MNPKYWILVVEDSDEDYYTTRRTLDRYRVFELERCQNGVDVVAKLSRQSESQITPSLILLDLNLPGKKDGRVVLRDLKQDKRFARIPVVILTTSDNPKDVDHCYQNGAGGYIVKPVDLDRFVSDVESMVKYWFETVQLPQ